jgi:hypothetical protein
VAGAVLRAADRRARDRVHRGSDGVAAPVLTGRLQLHHLRAHPVAAPRESVRGRPEQFQLGPYLLADRPGLGEYPRRLRSRVHASVRWDHEGAARQRRRHLGIQDRCRRGRDRAGAHRGQGGISPVAGASAVRRGPRGVEPGLPIQLGGDRPQRRAGGSFCGRGPGAAGRPGHGPPRGGRGGSLGSGAPAGGRGLGGSHPGRAGEAHRRRPAGPARPRVGVATAAPAEDRSPGGTRRCDRLAGGRVRRSLSPIKGSHPRALRPGHACRLARAPSTRARHAQRRRHLAVGVRGGVHSGIRGATGVCGDLCPGLPGDCHPRRSRRADVGRDPRQRARRGKVVRGPGRDLGLGAAAVHAARSRPPALVRRVAPARRVAPSQDGPGGSDRALHRARRL